ncbi:hypothetical protein V1506DRAFT_554010 [Lipomyces tetrasporus]
MDTENDDLESSYEYDEDEGDQLLGYQQVIRRVGKPEISEEEWEVDGDDDDDYDAIEEDEVEVEEEEEEEQTGVEPTAAAEQPVDDDSIEEDEEVFYIPLDLSAAPQSLDNISDCQVVDLHTGRPLISVGSRVYEGQWEDLVGTDMFFSQG